ncbi:2-C-methyl-D-erythritol 4-phosphate cytidylyltransferase [Endozoicomonas sp. 8E]|uniref:2-C-methyl-D-erythritol 4-phosphate cytidylyltransferase n=1 Tax=Endozoicomonas sp. 8E TaxID=3035692 RepID=UPI0029391D20|nr:2-C-methyl-D-erythritol 4-phosphate cytidylyltransferase [Endozoicomonas sp. 8E]WOG25454.1 2-C-methyl-D-erythritol 4-phosphate cytidylyltransferase [Endozoicomonas sp. 8E]
MSTSIPHEPRFWAVVPAAGVGRRMQSAIPKQYLEIHGRTLIEHTVERLLGFSVLEKLIVVIGAEDEYYKDIEMLRDSRIMLVQGGDERYHSVLNGLKALSELADAEDWVMVHDVARPCIRHSDLEWLVKQLTGHTTGGLLGMPVRDTMKRTSSSGEVIETVDRDELWHALTPQMFRMKLLYDALKKALDDGMPVTDEASAIEYAGFKPLMVEGHSDNIKVTRSADLTLAALYIQQQDKLIETV